MGDGTDYGYTYYRYQEAKLKDQESARESTVVLADARSKLAEACKDVEDLKAQYAEYRLQLDILRARHPWRALGMCLLQQICGNTSLAALCALVFAWCVTCAAFVLLQVVSLIAEVAH